VAKVDRQPEFLLRLKALPSGIPAPVRLRHGLKLRLRVCELKCVAVAEVGPDARRAAQDGSGRDGRAGVESLTLTQEGSRWHGRGPSRKPSPRERSWKPLRL
jgi:hypothetical protein